MKSDLISIALLTVLILAVIALIAGCVVSVTNPNARYDSFQRQCAAEGGHIYSPDSIAFCLTEDSRFIEVYP